MSFKKFTDLNVSTQVVMIYTNIKFNTAAIFRELKYYKIHDPPMTKKHKNIDKKKLEAPYGTIVSIQMGKLTRGLDMRNKKKKAVPNNPLKKKAVNQKNIDHFLNQMMVVMFLETHYVNIMLFNDNMKISGCKSDSDAFEAAMLLWDQVKTMTDDEGKSVWKMNPLFKDKHPSFLADTVMKNVGFTLGFSIDRYNLNYLMNSPEYSHIVDLSQFEASGHPNVNIKMKGNTPDDIKYDLLIDKDGKLEFELSDELKYRTKKKKEKEKFTTLIVFSSGEVILSGRYDKVMKRSYNFFMEEILKNRSKIEIKLKDSISSIKEIFD